VIGLAKGGEAIVLSAFDRDDLEPMPAEPLAFIGRDYERRGVVRSGLGFKRELRLDLLARRRAFPLFIHETAGIGGCNCRQPN
jgi:hypothetical protein